MSQDEAKKSSLFQLHPTQIGPSRRRRLQVPLTEKEGTVRELRPSLGRTSLPELAARLVAAWLGDRVHRLRGRMHVRWPTGGADGAPPWRGRRGAGSMGARPRGHKLLGEWPPGRGPSARSTVAKDVATKGVA